MLELFKDNILLYYFILLEIERGKAVTKKNIQTKKITLKEIKQDLSIESRTINFLENQNNRIVLINEGVNFLKKNYKKSDELYDFKNDDDLQEQFKISINAHFDWIIAYNNNKYLENAKFQNYKGSDIELIDTYYYFYEFLINNSSIEIEPESLKKNLKAYFTHLKDKVYQLY